MMNIRISTSLFPLRLGLAGWLIACCGWAGPLSEAGRAQNYSPEHPKVQAMLKLGTDFLTKSNDRMNDYDGGKTALVAYTLLKVTGDPELPKVKEGIATALQMVRGLRSPRHSETVVYSISVAAILLAEADPVAYRGELETILSWLVSVQKSHGGFGYLEKPTGDTSQVQYAMLALWTMYKAGLDVPTQTVEGAIRYLIATRDPSGGWGYQGTISNGPVPVAQTPVTKSLSTAGAGSILIAADILGFYRQMKRGNDEEDGIPEAFVRTDMIKKNRGDRREITLKRDDLDSTIDAAVKYHNSTDFTSGLFYYYWRYSQERYESFLEVREGKQNKSPAWYSKGVTELAGLQEPNGAWTQAKKADYTGDDVCTCFAMLFLVRSTQKAIGKINEGLLAGGYGLPDDVSSVRRVGDRIINDAETSVENLLALMEDENTGNVEIGLLPENLQLSKDPGERKNQVARLSRLLVSNDYKSRQLAAKLLGRSEDFDQAPELIYALLDSNDMVPMIAEESLRLLSRKLNAGTLKQNPTQEQKKGAFKYWSEWYLGLRPDYKFVAQ